MVVKDTLFSENKQLQLRGKLIQLPCVMGIINVNSDSFFSGSRAQAEVAWLKMAEQHLNEDAKIIDIGPTSTRPGASLSMAQKESELTEKVVVSVQKHFPNAIISVDTYHQLTAKASYENGAALINDISAGRLDTEMVPYILKKNIPYLAMHSKGTPENMKNLCQYKDVVAEVLGNLQSIENKFTKHGHTQLILDPGFGFAKNIKQNFLLLKYLKTFSKLKSPLMVGISRKSMIYKTLESTPAEALNGTTALNMSALINGANILRVHDVKEAVETIELFKHFSQNSN